MATIQPRFYEDRYPIGRLILDRANTLGVTRRELVGRLGYHNRLAKGHKVLSEILLTGTFPHDCKSLAVALEIDETILDDVLYANSLEEDERNGVVGQAIVKHYQDSSGRVPAFGRIEGYYFVRFAGYGDHDFGVPYDRFGSCRGSMMSVRRVPEASLGLKRGDRRLTGTFKDTLITITKRDDDASSV